MRRALRLVVCAPLLATAACAADAIAGPELAPEPEAAVQASEAQPVVAQAAAQAAEPAPRVGILHRCPASISSVRTAEPLYFVDGVVVDTSPLASLDPNQIESIEVIKGATLAALYGTRAANGVVLITLRRSARR